jgi:hypothetical protein
MSQTKPLGDRLVNGISKRILHARKYLYQNLKPLDSQQPKRIVFIFGCQRSGTTLMQQIFDRDFHTKVYGEFDAKVYAEYSEAGRSANGKHFRLKPLEEVKAVMDRDRARLIVAKPIVETQNALKLLAYFPGSKALFMYRNYAAVASSNLKLFGRMNGINNLWPIVNGASPNWRSEGVRQEIRAMVAARFHEDMNPYDAAALFWYVRNRFFFDLGLDRHPAVKPFKYEALVRDPSGMIRRVYRLVDREPPRARGTVVRGEAGSRKEIKLSADIDQLCRELLERLDRAFADAWTSGDRVRLDAPVACTAGLA